MMKEEQKNNKHNSKIYFALFALLGLCTLILYWNIDGIQYHDDDRPSTVRRRLSIFNGMKTSCKTAPKIKQPSTQGQIPPTYFATYPGKPSVLSFKSTVHISFQLTDVVISLKLFHRIRITSYTQINNGINRS